MTELINAIDKSLDFNEQNIRVLGTHEDTWYIAKDICVMLGFKNVTEALRNVPENQRGVTLVNPNTSQNCIKITEQAMYKLIIRSNKEPAQKFQDYICGEILPSIRKTGRYKLEELCKENLFELEESNKLKLVIEKENQQSIEESNKLKQVIEEKEKQFLEDSNKLRQIIEAKEKKIKQFIKDSKNIKDAFEAKEKLLIEESNKLKLQLEQRTNEVKKIEDFSINTNGFFNCSLKLPDNSSIIIPMRKDGYINATNLCKAGGKKFNNWNKLKNTKELITALESETGFPVSQLIEGSWIHPVLAIQMAQWISPKFFIQVSRWTKELTMQIQEKNKVLESKDNKTEIEQSQDSLTTKQQNKTNFEQSSHIVEFKLTLKNNTELSIPVSKDGYVNCTKLCKAGGKRIDNWNRLKQSEELLQVYSKLPHIRGTEKAVPHIRGTEKAAPEISGNAFCRVINGGNVSLNNQGTYYPMDIAIQIAQWVDPYFALQVSRWTRELLLFGKVELGNEKSSEELDNKFQERIIELTQEKEILKQVLENKDQDIKTLKTDLLQEQKDVISTKKSLMQTQTKFSQRHKFTDASCVYILQDPDCKYSKLKIGLTTDINQRLMSDRTMIPNIKVRYIMYNDHCELFEKAIKVRCKENLELPSHEWVFESLDNLIKIYNEIDKSNGFSSIIETDLWRYNLEPPPSEEYQEPEPVNIPTYYGTPISQISNFLSGPQLLRGDYLIKNNNAPQGQRWCNGWCQCYKIVTDFAKRSVSPMTICIYCENMLDVAIIKVKSELMTEKEIRKNPSKILLEPNQQICRKCETIKHTNDFDEKKRQCKQCRNIPRLKFKENFDDIVESEIKKLRSLNKYDRDKRLDRYNRDKLYKISSVCKIGRKETDIKRTILENLVKYFDTKDLA